MNQIKIGMIGTGRIAERFMSEAKEAEGLTIAAVYNPRRESAAQFAKAHGIPEAAESEEGLLAAVDAVYIAAPHETHAVYARNALSAGKHVLCEKPLCFSGREAEELFAYAQKQGLILMEGIKTAYCPGFLKILEVIGSGMIGQIKDVEAAFTRLSPANVREIWEPFYGGSFLEFGTYAMLPLVKLYGAADAGVTFLTTDMKTGTDTFTKAVFDFGGRFGTAKTGLRVKSEGQLLVAGTYGYLLAPSPWWLTKKFEIHHEDPHQIETYEAEFEGAGLRYEIRAFLNRIEGKEDPGWIRPEESIWLANQMEAFLAERKEGRSDAVRVKGFCPSEPADDGAGTDQKENVSRSPGIWAHRGCCMAYPENTIPAFCAAAKQPGLVGIELDVQLTKDGEPVVIHDETVDRTTDGHGNVRDFTLQELKQLRITGSRCKEPVEPALSVPTLREMFEAVLPRLREGMLINIEMKNSVIRYEGMEEKVLALVAEYGLQKNIVYSSFLPESMGLMKELDPSVRTGILGGELHWCIQQAKKYGADAVHPWIGGLDPNPEGLFDLPEEMPVRCWNSEEPFYGDGRILKELHMEKYALLGATDIIVNAPEMYLKTVGQHGAVGEQL